MPTRLPFSQPIRRVLAAEAFEPTLAWGLRMALASVGPILWGTLTGNADAAQWMALTAQAICWVELKSGFGGRLRILLGGIVVALLATALGSIAGSGIVLSVLLMLGIGFLSGLFKNLGDRGAGLSISLYVLFIIGSAWPLKEGSELLQRLRWVTIGGLWNAVVGIVSLALAGERAPARRAAALVWRATARLLTTVAQGWDDGGTRAGIRLLYEKEKEVRAAIDSALAIHDSSTVDGSHRAEVGDVRRTGGLVGALAASMGEELMALRRHQVTGTCRRRLSALVEKLAALAQTIGLATVTLRTPDEALQTAMDDVRNEVAAMHTTLSAQSGTDARLARILQLAERALRLADAARLALQKLRGERPIFQSPPVLRLVLALHPRHWWSAIRLLLAPNTSTARYAGRIAAASALAMAVYLLFDIPRGYWLPLTVIVVAQPYFGATLAKARDRVIGTVLGGMVGGLILLVPTGLFVREAALALCSIGMVYFIRRNYSIGTAFVTITLVLVLSLPEQVTPEIILIRALCTAGGAGLAVAAGFWLLPTWDKAALPGNMASAFGELYRYFATTFFQRSTEPWTAIKRKTERASAAAFDSLSRYLSEPGATRRVAGMHYGTLTHLVRITHEVNALHLHEGGSRKEESDKEAEESARNCLRYFNRVLFLLRERGHLPDLSPLPLDTLLECPSTRRMLPLLEHITDELKALEADLKEQKNSAMPVAA